MVNLSIKKIFQLLPWLITIILSACVTVESSQTACEKKYEKFTSIAACFKKSIKDDPYFQATSESNFSKQYIDYTNRVIFQVERKKITEAYAQSLLSSEYKKLKPHVVLPTTKNKLHNIPNWPPSEIRASDSTGEMNFGDVDEPEKPGPK
jgi:hypothetical protein